MLLANFALLIHKNSEFLQKQRHEKYVSMLYEKDKNSSKWIATFVTWLPEESNGILTNFEMCFYPVKREFKM